MKLKSRKRLFYPQFPIMHIDLHLEDTNILGKGKFGKIYKYSDTSVLKIMKKHHIIDEKMIRQVKAEKENHSLCSHHPGVISLLDVWQDSYNLYMLYPLCQVNLVRIAAKVGVLPDEAVLAVVNQIAGVLKFLHDLGIIHRDIKIENVLVSNEDGRLLCSDFGLSKKLPRRQRTETICGTLQYMAPEIVNEKKYDHSVDWWSFGIMIYRLSQGQLPFAKGENHKEMAKNIKLELLKSHPNEVINSVIQNCTMLDGSERNLAVNSLLKRICPLNVSEVHYNFITLYNTCAS